MLDEIANWRQDPALRNSHQAGTSVLAAAKSTFVSIPLTRSSGAASSNEPTITWDPAFVLQAKDAFWTPVPSPWQWSQERFNPWAAGDAVAPASIPTAEMAARKREARCRLMESSLCLAGVFPVIHPAWLRLGQTGNAGTILPSLSQLPRTHP